MRKHELERQYAAYLRAGNSLQAGKTANNLGCFHLARGTERDLSLAVTWFQRDLRVSERHGTVFGAQFEQFAARGALFLTFRRCRPGRGASILRGRFAGASGHSSSAYPAIWQIIARFAPDAERAGRRATVRKQRATTRKPSPFSPRTRRAPRPTSRGSRGG